ncbi:MAG TPA: alpha/beta hydrolase [Alphaproteobacteria bacterium]|nr:alpha/beta hydrolase [Alphaproteobacteria bacterium]
MLERPALSASKFCELSDGKRLRYVLHEPEKARGTLLIAPGRREFIEKKFSEMGQEFLQRGFRLIFFEWRGQGLSDRYLAGSHHQRDHISSFDTHLDDLSQFYDKVVKPCQSGPLLVTGHSMGAHLILRWLIERQMVNAVAGVLLTAPMLALSAMPVQALAKAMTWTAMRLGHGADYGPAQHDYGPQDMKFEHNPLNHDPDRFEIIQKYFTAYPELTVGGVTWAWLDAALHSLHHIQQRKYFDHLTLPLLNIVGSADHVTPANEISHIVKRMPQAQNVVIPDALHDILNEANLYRLEAWKHIDGFLTKLKV